MRTNVLVALVLTIGLLPACGGGGSSDAATGTDGGVGDTGGQGGDGNLGGDKSGDGAASPDTATDGVTDKAGGDGASEGAPMMGFVRGTIAGEVLDYRGLVASTIAGSPPGILSVGGAMTYGDIYNKWSIYGTNKLGKQVCGEAGNPFTSVGFQRVEDKKMITYVSTKPGASCTVEFTEMPAAIGDLAKGTFSGTLIDMVDDKRIIVVTDGAFEAARY